MIQSIETHLERVMSSHQDHLENEIDVFRSSRARLGREMRSRRSRELKDLKLNLYSDEKEEFRVLSQKHEESMCEAAEEHRSAMCTFSVSSLDDDDEEEEEEEEKEDIVLGCIDVSTRNGRHDLRRRRLITNERGQEMFTPLYVHVGLCVYTIQVNEHSTVAWLLSEIIRMQDSLGSGNTTTPVMLTGMMIYRTKRVLDLEEDLISCLGHYNELVAFGDGM